MDALWREDGIEYHTLFANAPPGHTLATQLYSACTFLRTHGPGLVCSSCPKLRTTIVAAYLLQTGKAQDVQSALAQVKLHSAGRQGDEGLGAEELEALETMAEQMDADRLVSTPRLSGLTVRTSGAGGIKRTEEDASTPPSKAPKVAGAAMADGTDTASTSSLTPMMRGLDHNTSGLGIFKREERTSEEALA